jgi:hypothetical protein
MKTILDGKPEWKRALRKHVWEDNIKMGLEGVDWINLAQDSDFTWTSVNTVIIFGFWHHGVR